MYELLAYTFAQVVHTLSLILFTHVKNYAAVEIHLYSECKPKSSPETCKGGWGGERVQLETQRNIGIRIILMSHSQ